MFHWKLCLSHPPLFPNPAPREAGQAVAPPHELLKTGLIGYFSSGPLTTPVVSLLPSPEITQECFAQMKPGPLLLIWLDLTYCVNRQTHYQGSKGPITMSCLFIFLMMVSLIPRSMGFTVNISTSDSLSILCQHHYTSPRNFKFPACDSLTWRRQTMEKQGGE